MRNILTASSRKIMDLEARHSAHNYHPIPFVFHRGRGVFVWDVEGNKAFDFLSAYSAVNQGHCHPRIRKALVDQSKLLTLSSRAFYNDRKGPFCKYLTKLTGYDKVLMMNSGAEGVETALKLARKWAYIKKKVPRNKAIVLACEDNFHGRTLGVISMSTDPDSRNDFGPYLPRVGPVCPADMQHRRIKFGDIESLREALEVHGEHAAAFIVEPIQGEAGVIVPPKGYLKAAFDLCKKYNVLFISDEIQTGLGRTGKMMAFEHEKIQPDMVILGKALSGGFYPVSAVLANDDVMLCIEPGQHGSTFGGNPLACAIAEEALKVLVEEKLCENSRNMGKLLASHLENLKSEFPSLITQVRGRGLLHAIEFSKETDKTAWDFCIMLRDSGVLAKPTHDVSVRLAPPLVISKSQVDKVASIMRKTMKQFAKQ